MDMNRYTQTLSSMRKELKTPPDVEAPLGISINGARFRKDYEKLLTIIESNPQLVDLLVKESKQLIRGGVDFDLITNETLVGLLSLKKTMRKALEKPLKKMFKSYPPHVIP